MGYTLVDSFALGEDNLFGLYSDSPEGRVVVEADTRIGRYAESQEGSFVDPETGLFACFAGRFRHFQAEWAENRCLYDQAG
jgi:hypothetical protein